MVNKHLLLSYVVFDCPHELRKQKEIWKAFGVDYNSEKKKQEAIWNEFKTARVRQKSNADSHAVTDPLYKVFVPASKMKEYRSFKGAIYEHLRHRKDFQGKVDQALIERVARLYADWLYVEEIMTLCSKGEIRQFSMALGQIDAMLVEAFDALGLSPKARNRVAADLQSDNGLSEKLKQLIGATT